MIDVILDALIDALSVFVVVLILNIIISFFGKKLSFFLLKSKYKILIGSAIGLIPQCGFSLLATSLFTKKKITLGTLIAIYIATSDEAIILLLRHINKSYYILPLLFSKFVIALIVGTIIDIIFKKKKDEVINALDEEKQESQEISQSQKLHNHLFHPLLDSLKIFLYVLIINIIFNTIIYYVKEDTISNFLISNQYLTPLLSVIIGFIPNCASSIMLTELLIKGSLSFWAALGGLICNAGLGITYLLKNKKNIKDALIIFVTLFIVGIIFAYLSVIF